MNNKPNILFAIADDALHMSAYGHTFLNTPNFDRVAKEGVLFANAFTTNPNLGLYIVRQLLEDYGATINVEAQWMLARLFE